MAVPVLRTVRLCCLSVFYGRRAIKREYNEIIRFAVRDTEIKNAHKKKQAVKGIVCFNKSCLLEYRIHKHMYNAKKKKNLARCEQKYSSLKHPIHFLCFADRISQYIYLSN